MEKIEITVDKLDPIKNKSNDGIIDLFLRNVDNAMSDLPDYYRITINMNKLIASLTFAEKIECMDVIAKELQTKLIKLKQLRDIVTEFKEGK